jgi:excisionase family DNA binding protein
MEKQFLNVEQAALFLCISKSKLMKMCMNREVTYHKAGRLNIFNRKDLEEYLDRNTILSEKDLQNEADNNLINLKMKKDGFGFERSFE